MLELNLGRIYERRIEMKFQNPKKNKHLTKDDRDDIQSLLDRRMTFKAIARVIGKDPTTVSKEVKKHMQCFADQSLVVKDKFGNVMESGCPSLVRAPFVCNPCHNRNKCRLPKRFYKAKEAQEAYELLLRDAREGIPLNKKEFYEIDAIITKGLRNGQHIYQIMQTNNIPVSKSTIYRHFERGYFSAANIDLPRKVKFKSRKGTHSTYVPRATRIGRTYDCFVDYLADKSILYWLEIDTVIGRIGGKVIMTFHFTSCNFMFGLLLNNKTSLEVTEKIIMLKQKLVDNDFSFGRVFSPLLADNGGEFANVSVFENNLDGILEAYLFYCDPNSSYQKPYVEKNHSLFRDIVPSGSSFDDFTQETVDLIFSHVNSVKREVLNGKTPYELFAFLYGNKLASVLDIIEIPADEVVQSPKLLRDQR